jgi:hypothetical protein
LLFHKSAHFRRFFARRTLAWHSAMRAVWPKTAGDNRQASNDLKDSIHGLNGKSDAR